MDKNTPFIALDLEMNQPSNNIIQVGMALGSRMQSSEEWLVRQWLLDPLEPVAEPITALTGITTEDILTQSVSWREMARELGALLDEHKPFINPVTWGSDDSAELLAGMRKRDIEFPYFGRRCVDVKTVHSFIALTQGKNPSGGLSRTMGQYKLQFLGEQHRAHHDAFNTLRLFIRLLERQENLDGMVTLAKGV